MAASKPDKASRAAELPPLNALRTFEAAARHLHFTRAARELCVTQTAISHQIRLLEAHLGASLFVRGPRGLSLTAEGASWAHELSDVFARLHEINRRLRARAERERPLVAVSVIPSFAARWLVPRLGQFFAAHPGIDVRISPNEQLADFALEPIDLGIRFGFGHYPGLVVEKLADDGLVVVCAPQLLKRRKLVVPEDLRRHVLLHDDEPEGWAHWLAVRGVRSVDHARGSVLTASSMLLTAAVDGNGVALARYSLALDELAAGRLVQPFPKLGLTPLRRAYYCAAPRERLARPEVAAFRDWLRAQARSLVYPGSVEARRLRRAR